MNNALQTPADLVPRLPADALPADALPADALQGLFACARQIRVLPDVPRTATIVTPMMLLG